QAAGPSDILKHLSMNASGFGNGGFLPLLEALELVSDLGQLLTGQLFLDLLTGSLDLAPGLVEPVERLILPVLGSLASFPAELLACLLHLPAGPAKLVAGPLDAQTFQLPSHVLGLAAQLLLFPGKPLKLLIALPGVG